MKISLNWLKRYLDIDLPAEEISEILTDIGLEVEGFERFQAVKGGLEGVIVGEVKEVKKHPNADRLSLTRVDVGQDEMLQIVCGAPNVAEGQKVLVATIGTTLYPQEGDPFQIKKGEIRGESSEGMICAEDELGLGNDHSGIMVLESSAKVGTAAYDHFKFKDDFVFDVALTPNRSDATSHLGVAKDIAAYLRINGNWTGNIRMPEYSSFKVDVNKHRIDVEIEDEHKCPRYSAVYISDVNIKASPSWMQQLLRAIGVRPVNNVVDITNFVLHEYGQPLHAFDAEKIEAYPVRVKTLGQGMPFNTLDGEERQLDKEDLMICSGNNIPLCIAGVYGGINSGVTENTTSIFLESAYFDANSIRKTSTRHLLRTEAAKVFEKGADPAKTLPALKRACVLFREYAGAEVSSEVIDVYPKRIEEKEILLKYQRVNGLIGTSMDKDMIHDILRAMKMELKPVDENSVLVKVPTDKADVLREVDLIEEILRIYGLNKVELPSQMKTTVIHKSYPTKRMIRNRISDFLAAHGFNEMMGLSLIESKYYDEQKEGLVRINNTSNTHLDVMRPDAVISGLKTMAHNLNHQQSDLRLFEFGSRYAGNGKFKESEFLSVFITGDRAPGLWQGETSKGVDFYDMKKWVLAIMEYLQLNKLDGKSLQEHPYFGEGFEYFHEGNTVVTFGRIRKDTTDKMGISQEVYCAVFEFEAVQAMAKSIEVQVQEPSRYPSVRRDLAVVIDEKTKYEDLLAIVNKTDLKLIREVGLFDIYKNEEQLGKNKKSYALKFIFQDDEKTLRDKDVDKIMQKLISSFEEKLGASIRS